MGVIITLLCSFLLNSTITISSESTSYIDLHQAIPHYEFSNENAKYIEYLDIKYKVKPPFYVFSFNSNQELSKPKGYELLEIPAYGDCVYWNDRGNKLILSAKASQFKVSECSDTLRYVKLIDKKDLVNVYFNSSWRKGSEGDKFYEEEGISISNKFSKPIKNYIFIYDQGNNSQIKKRFKNCSEIRTFINQEEIENRSKFFENSSRIAVKFDLEPRETKELIVRCYN